jgi:hypothetical protein
MLPMRDIFMGTITVFVVNLPGGGKDEGCRF